MENTVDCVQHQGVIKRITPKVIYVKILALGACASCNAKGMCNTAEMEEKTIEVVNDGRGYKTGEHVVVIMDKKLGTQAVLLGYFYPFLILLGVLIIMISISGNEGLSALLALGVLVPYYYVIYLFRNKLKKKFTFRLNKLV